MHAYPHHYEACATAGPEGSVVLDSAGLPPLETQPPPQFGGPSGYWSPETLLVAAAVDCYVLSFRAIARAAQFEWLSLRCSGAGTLDRVDNLTRFTRFDFSATLTVPPGSDEHKAMRMLERAKSICLVTNSMNAEKTLQASVVVGS